MVEATTRGQASATATPTPWYRDRRRLIGAVVLAVLLLGVGAWVVKSSERRKEEFAARSLNQARAAAEAGNLPLASSELQRLIETYRGTDAATEAVITLNQVRMAVSQMPSRQFRQQHVCRELSRVGDQSKEGLGQTGQPAARRRPIPPALRPAQEFKNRFKESGPRMERKDPAGCTVGMLGSPLQDQFGDIHCLHNDAVFF